MITEIALAFYPGDIMVQREKLLLFGIKPGILCNHMESWHQRFDRYGISRAPLKAFRRFI